jgi:hypothetical protein
MTTTETAFAAGRDRGASVPAGPNRADFIGQIAWSYARLEAGRRATAADHRALAEAFIAGAA